MGGWLREDPAGAVALRPDAAARRLRLLGRGGRTRTGGRARGSGHAAAPGSEVTSIPAS